MFKLNEAEFTGTNSAPLVTIPHDPLFKTNSGCNIEEKFKEEAKSNNSNSPRCNLGRHSGSQMNGPPTNNLLVKAVTIKVPLKISNQEALAVVDSGAEVTELKIALFFSSLHMYNESMVRQAQSNLVVAEQGCQMEACGVVKLLITLGEHKYEWEVYIAPIADDMLLGCDIMDELDITLNTKDGIEIEGQWIPCEVKRRPHHVGRICLKKM